MSEYIQDPLLQKCALKIAATGELVALGVYRDMPQGFLVYVEYLENAPYSESIAASARHWWPLESSCLWMLVTVA